MELLLDYKLAIKEISFWSGVAFSAMFMGTLIASMVFREKVPIKIKEEAPNREELLLTEEPSFQEPDIDKMLSAEPEPSTSPAPSTFSFKELGATSEAPSSPKGLFTGQSAPSTPQESPSPAFQSPVSPQTPQPKIRSLELSIDESPTAPTGPASHTPAPFSSPLSGPASTSESSQPKEDIPLNLNIELSEESEKPSDDDLLIDLKSERKKGRKKGSSKGDDLTLIDW